jgi:metal-responsive CopG/Arc/MetJ family transcriptional regulator
MKTAISIPNEIFEEAEKTARRLGVSRSELYANAVLEFIRHHRSDDVTEKLNEIYDREPSKLDSILHTLQYTSLDREEW